MPSIKHLVLLHTKPMSSIQNALKGRLVPKQRFICKIKFVTHLISQKNMYDSLLRMTLNPPRGHLAISAGILVFTIGRGSVQHLMGKGQRC